MMKKISTRLRLYSLANLGACLLMGCAHKPVPSEYLDYQTKTRLVYPVIGESFVATGGRTVQQNPNHIYLKDQRFALDIVALKPGAEVPTLDNLVERILAGKIAVYKDNDYRVSENHFCFGRPVVAPGNGVVVDARDGISDNIPGVKSAWHGPGNYVVIDHLNGEFSMMAHFKQGSVLVSKGDQVIAGNRIGECGNSGHSNLPHLHYHLQTSPRWFKGEGLPAQFVGYYADGKRVSRGEPVQGQLISAGLTD